jgi:hypothetical protein
MTFLEWLKFREEDIRPISNQSTMMQGPAQPNPTIFDRLRAASPAILQGVLNRASQLVKTGIDPSQAFMTAFGEYSKRAQQGMPNYQMPITSMQGQGRY